MRAAMWTAIPPTSSSISSTSPEWRPIRTSKPRERTASAIARPHRIARAGPSKVARQPSPSVFTSRPGSPDRDYSGQAVERLGHNRACLSVARKLLKRSYHTLRELDEEALQPA